MRSIRIHKTSTRSKEIAQATHRALAEGQAGPHLVPDEAVPGLLRLLEALARGQSPMFVEDAEGLTTQEAADLLNVSRPTLVKLLEDGAIPYRRVGTHRRLRLADVLAYRETRSQRQKDAFDRLFQMEEEMGLPD